jgi:hypothetical protein
VKGFAHALKAQGSDYFYDRDTLMAGDVYEEKIFSFIDTADLFILCWSKNAAESEYVGKERHRAMQHAYPFRSLCDATLKIYQIASSYARAVRRQKENVEKGISNASVEEIQQEIEKRDYIDSHRENSPLMKADDAIELDTSDLTIEEEVNAIIELFKKKVGEEVWNNMVQSH